MIVCMEDMAEKLGISALAASCSEELSRHRHKQPTDGRFCLELMRRATIQQLDEAWSVMVSLFTETVLIWLRAHPGYSLAITYDSEENYIALTFTRFWSAVREQHLKFYKLPAILSYLHATLNSTIIDTLRSYMRVKCVSLLDPGIAESLEAVSEESDDSEETWKSIQALLENEEERQVMYLLYYCGLKPREIVARFPATFHDVKEIYRLNHNIIERLRRKRDRLRWLLSDEETEITPDGLMA